MKFYCLNNISKKVLNEIKLPDVVTDSIDEADSILVRSFDMNNMEIGNNIHAIARAGAGVNNIPVNKMAERGIIVFNTPGANANAVKELVLCSLFLASRDIIGGNEWIKNNVNDENIANTAEKIKSKFAGFEVLGKKIAVLGLGKIGILVANACIDLGMKVIGFDPYLSVSSAFKLDRSIEYVNTINEAVSGVDFVTVHIPANDSTAGLFNAELFEKMKKGTVLLNFSRGSLVNDNDLREAIEVGIIRKYVTDFADPAVVTFSNTIVLPHLGASTEEAEENCAEMAINQLSDFIENGNITNSVNYPAVNAGPKREFYRICICHKNIPGVIAKFSTYISERKSNIDNLTNKSKGEYSYTVIDIDNPIDVSGISDIDGIIKVRVIE